MLPTQEQLNKLRLVTTYSEKDVWLYMGGRYMVWWHRDHPHASVFIVYPVSHSNPKAVVGQYMVMWDSNQGSPQGRWMFSQPLPSLEAAVAMMRVIAA